MMRQIIVPLLLTVVAGCASHPTPYQKEKKKEGYADEQLDSLHVSSFKANSRTKPEWAKVYAEFHAIDVCSQDQKVANMMDIADKTVQKTVTRTSGSMWGPSYGFGYGMYPYYSRYSGYSLGVGFNTMSSDSWNETYIFPYIDVFYNCSEKVFRPEILFKEISAEQMKLLVKDLKGALQVEKLLDHSPNEKIIEPGDIILKANGKRIEHIYQLISLFDGNNTAVEVLIMREGEKKNLKMKAKDVTADIQKSADAIISKVCHEKKDKHQKELSKNRLCQGK